LKVDLVLCRIGPAARIQPPLNIEQPFIASNGIGLTLQSTIE
jgi:hypothetical protein